MLDWLIIYGIFMSFWLVLRYHNQLVVPGHGPAFWRRAGGLYIKGVTMAFCVIMGIFTGPIQGLQAYGMWWENYTVDHSMVVWWLVTVPITVGLWSLKHITYLVLRDPAGKYRDPVAPVPFIQRIDMRAPLVLNVAFYLWILLSPTLPFFSCFIRVFLLKHDPHKLFAFVF